MPRRATAAPASSAPTVLAVWTAWRIGLEPDPRRTELAWKLASIWTRASGVQADAARARPPRTTKRRRLDTSVSSAWSRWGRGGHLGETRQDVGREIDLLA